jgi:hypothetical protein
MSFIFLNSSGESLTATDLIQLTSSLNEGSEVSLIVRNNSLEDALNPLIFLTASSDLGSLEYPSKVPARTDYNDLLLWGSTLNESSENTAGLYYKDHLNNITYFSFTNGSSYLNGIPVGNQILKDSEISITLGFNPKLGDNTRRLYVGVEIYDSRANI